MSDRTEDTVSDAEAVSLGFQSAADFRAWRAAGSPTGRCSNDRCGWAAYWPDLDKPCLHCGAPIDVDVPGDHNP